MVDNFLEQSPSKSLYFRRPLKWKGLEHRSRLRRAFLAPALCVKDRELVLIQDPLALLSDP